MLTRSLHRVVRGASSLPCSLVSSHRIAARSFAEDSLGSHVDSSMKKLKRAQEEGYFARKDRIALQKLLNVLEQSADPEDSHMKSALHGIFEKHGINLNAQLEADLREWKKWQHSPDQGGN